MEYVKVTVDLLIPVTDISEGQVADTVSAILTENLETNGVIKDWQYHNGRYAAEPYDMPENYEEGEAFNF